MMNIVFLDGKTINPGDLVFDELKSLGNFEVYPQSTKEEGIQRGKKADIVLSNKFIIDEEVLTHWPQLKFVCITATGYNNVDLEATSARGILVSNVSGYSQHSTAQHTFALLLELCNQCGDYNSSVQAGDWTNSGVWSYTRKPIVELAGLKLGLLGLGSIGMQVAQIGIAMGMTVIASTRNRQTGEFKGIPMVNLEDLFRESDVLSLHAPLNEQSFEIINKDNLKLMKSTAFLINAARGGLVNEDDLREALIRKQIAGAALDVLSKEPPAENHPLIGLDNCIGHPLLPVKNYYP